MPHHEALALRYITERLAHRFDTLPRAHVAEVVAEVHHGFDCTIIRDSVPGLVEHEAWHRLGQLGS